MLLRFDSLLSPRVSTFSSGVHVAIVALRVVDNNNPPGLLYPPPPLSKLILATHPAHINLSFSAMKKPFFQYQPMSRNSFEDKPLMNASSEEDLEHVVPPSPTPTKPSRFVQVIVLLQTALNLLLLLTIGLLLKNVHTQESVHAYNALYSPAQDAVEYVVQQFHEGFGPSKSIYQQPPSPEVDAAWEDLYNFGVSRITKEEASLLVNQTYRIPGDEEHHVVQLDVFHQLHCLNMLRKSLSPDYYPLPQNATEARIEKMHWGHCIESIRQSLMCSADISTLVWQWVERVQEVRIMGNIVHTCRNYDKIKEWGIERRLEHDLDFTGFH